MQNSCSGTCNLTDAGETAETCNPNGTNSDPSDDYITFSLNPVGANLGATYSVTADNGGTVTLAGGGAATGVSYNSSTAFRLQNGSADGATNFTVTVTDVADGTCMITTMVMQNSCSGTCPTITNPTPTQSICEGQTTSLQVTTDAISPDQIEFVYFTTQQTNTAMYSGGTSLGSTTPSGGVASISNISLPIASTYFVYAILTPTPADVTCRPSEEMIITVNPYPDVNLIVSDTTICNETTAMVAVSDSEIGVSYQLRNNANDSPVGSPVSGTGNTINFSINNLSTAGTYTYNVLASNSSTGCTIQVLDLAEVVVMPCDYDFDLPTCLYPACHFTSADIYLGAGVNSESGSASETQSLDDGVNFPNNIRPNIGIRIPVTIYNNTGNTAYLSAWIDWNNDGDFDDAGEQIANEIYNPAVYNGSFVVSLATNVPATIPQNQNIRARFRLSTDSSIAFSPCGAQTCAIDGEVEDFIIQAECPPTICLPVQIQINRGN